MNSSVPARASSRSLILLILIIGLQGCYHFRVTTPNPDPATDYEHRTMHSYFWGLVQETQPADDCLSNSLDEVEVSTNLGYSLISVVTLGIWVPMDVRWRCGKESFTPDDGDGI